jgi:hypothetical protein
MPRVQVWNRDIDRSASDSFLKKIADYSGISLDVIEAMTLRNFEDIFATRKMDRVNRHIGICTWLNVLGIYHRYRTGYGMQYCPCCLKETMQFKKIWRLSFVTMCPIHHCGLMDSCHACGKPVIFYRTDSFYPSCHICGVLLTAEPIRNDNDQLLILQKLQTQLLGVWFSQKVEMNSVDVTSHDFFYGIAALLRALMLNIRHKKIRSGDFQTSQRPRRRMEQQRIEGRVERCLLLADILQDWPTQAVKLIHLQNMTQRAFDKKALSLNWLKVVFDAIPQGVPKIRTALKSSLQPQLSKIQREKPEGWRTARARALLKAANVKI